MTGGTLSCELAARGLVFFVMVVGLLSGACTSSPTPDGVYGGDSGPAMQADGGSCEGGCGVDGGLADGGLDDGGLADGGLNDGGLADGGLNDGGLDDGGSGAIAAETAALNSLASAFNAFHIDTAGWPLGDGVWSSTNYENDMTILPGVSFTTSDTAMFFLPAGVPACDAEHTGGPGSPCWNGPYLSITGAMPSLGTAPWLDAWGRPLMYSYLRPLDGNEGSITAAPNGLIYIWSRGPDGLDGFTCSDGAQDMCPIGYDSNDYVSGVCSATSCDDIIVKVADSSR